MIEARLTRWMTLALVAAGCSEPDPGRSRSSSSASPPDSGEVAPVPSGSGSASAVSSGSAVPVADPVAAFCQPILEARREALKKLCNEADLKTAVYREHLAMLDSAYESCRTFLKADAATILFDQARANTCRASVEKAIANDPFHVLAISDHEGCAGVFRGTLTTGSPCERSVQCNDGLRCTTRSGAAAKTCEAPGREGEPCDFLGPPYTGDHPACEKGLFCSGDKCKPQIAEGGACSYEPGACGTGLRCAARECMPVGPRGEGARCSAVMNISDRPDCDVGFYCDPFGDNDAPGGKPTATCKKKLPAGSPCENDIECVGRCSTGRGNQSLMRGGEKGQCVSACGKG